jgi:uncharacterized RDD family membrane protein YckC
MPPKPVTLRRIAATIIDYTVICAFSFWFIWTFGEPNEQGGRSITGWPGLIPVFFWFVWLVVAETSSGTTLGHMLMKLKIVSVHDEKITFGQALIRRICDGLEITGCFGLIAFLLVKTTQSHQRLGDLLAKTLVVDQDFKTSRQVFDFEQEDVMKHNSKIG